MVAASSSSPFIRIYAHGPDATCAHVLFLYALQTKARVLPSPICIRVLESMTHRRARTRKANGNKIIIIICLWRERWRGERADCCISTPAPRMYSLSFFLRLAHPRRWRQFSPSIYNRDYIRATLYSSVYTPLLRHCALRLPYEAFVPAPRVTFYTDFNRRSQTSVFL